MFDRKRKSSKPPPARKPSGEHPSVVEYRQKLDSINDTQLEELKGLNARLARMAERKAKKRDPRREASADPRQDSSIPPDVVQVPDGVKLPELDNEDIIESTSEVRSGKEKA